MKSALLLVDIQNDYFPGGKMPLVQFEKAVANAQKLLNFYRENQWLVYHIQHISIRPGAVHFLPDTEGAEIHTQVAPLTTEVVIQKHFPNSFRDTTLFNHLIDADIRHLCIAGAMSHMCIDATTRAAFDHKFACTVIADACATRDLKYGNLIVPAQYAHAGFMSALNGVYAKVVSTQEFLENDLTL